jgi:hypothetical protein
MSKVVGFEHKPPTSFADERVVRVHAGSFCVAIDAVRRDLDWFVVLSVVREQSHWLFDAMVMRHGENLLRTCGKRKIRETL